MPLPGGGFTRSSCRRWLTIAVLATCCLSLAGCDRRQFGSEVNVQVRLRDDATVVLAARVAEWAMQSGVAPDTDELLSELVKQLSPGEIHADSHVYSGLFWTDIVGVAFVPSEPDSLTVDVGAIAATLRQVGVRSDAEISVVVCNAAGRGGASGTSVDIEVHHSCGVVEEPLAAIPPDASVTLHRVNPSLFERLTPSGPVWQVILLAVTAALALWRLEPRFQRWRKVAAVALVVVVVLAGALAMRLFSGSSDPLNGLETVGQLIGGRYPSSPLAWISVMIAVVGVIGGLVQTARAADRRTADQPHETRAAS